MILHCNGRSESSLINDGRRLHDVMRWLIQFVLNFPFFEKSSNKIMKRIFETEHVFWTTFYG